MRLSSSYWGPTVTFQVYLGRDRLGGGEENIFLATPSPKALKKLTPTPQYMKPRRLVACYNKHLTSTILTRKNRGL